MPINQINSTPIVVASSKRPEPVTVTKVEIDQAALESPVKGAVALPLSSTTTLAISPDAMVERPEELRSAHLSLPVTTPTDDSVTLLSSSDSPTKPASLDGKSVTSATTYAMDEKESLRPDDSASIRAAPDDEDVFSAPGSRVGSEHGARAFRDQLHELSVLAGPVPQRAIPPPFQVQVVPNGPAVLASSRPAVSAPPLPTHSDQGIQTPETGFPPDEKLLAALQSPRDRLWVLKLEQDVIDFVKNPK